MTRINADTKKRQKNLWQKDDGPGDFDSPHDRSIFLLQMGGDE
jgi:hypothetical protein